MPYCCNSQDIHLYELYKSYKLPKNFHIIGCGRKEVKKNIFNDLKPDLLEKNKNLKLDPTLHNDYKALVNELGDFKNVNNAWDLNERHYGALTGLNKDDMKKKLGEGKVHQFRRSWDLRPDPLDKKNPYHPINIQT